MSQDSLCQQCQEQEYFTIVWVRRGIIIVSAIALIVNILFIHKSTREYIQKNKPNILRLGSSQKWNFFILSHYCFDNGCICIQGEDKQRELMITLIKNGQSYMNALQGFINLFCYSITYLIAIVTSLYVRHIFYKLQHQDFQKNYKISISVTIIFCFLWYLIPVIMTFILDAPFSFGPVGHSFTHSGNKTYLLYSGIITRKQNNQVFTVIWTLFPLIIFFIFHLKILKDIRQKLKEYQERHNTLVTQSYEDQDSFKLTFMRKLSSAGIGIAVVQFFNASKKILSDFGWSGGTIDFSFNIVFDFLPFGVIIIYCCFYRNIESYSNRLP